MADGTKRIKMLKYHNSAVAGALEPGNEYELSAKVAEQIVADFPDCAEFVEMKAKSVQPSPEDRMIGPAQRKRK